MGEGVYVESDGTEVVMLEVEVPGGWIENQVVSKRNLYTVILEHKARIAEMEQDMKSVEDAAKGQHKRILELEGEVEKLSTVVHICPMCNTAVGDPFWQERAEAESIALMVDEETQQLQ